MKFAKMTCAGLVAWSMGCGLAQSESVLEPGAEPLEVSRQALTRSWAARAPNKNCRFGDSTLNHQAATNTRASGRLEETLTITGLAGRRINSLQLRTPSGSTASFQYDDIMLINYKDNVLMTSDRRLAGYLAGTSPTSVSSVPLNYSWSKIKNTAIDNQTAEVAWCAIGNTSCTVPPTETSGTLNVNIPSFQAMDSLTYMGLPDSRSFTLVTVGDNDDGTFNSGFQTKDTDCAHGNVDVEIIVSSSPVNTCTWEVVYDETASKFDDSSWTGPSTDPMGTLLGGSTYTAVYNYSTGGYTVTGFNEGAQAVATWTYTNANINNNQLSMWGAVHTIRGNEVYDSTWGLVGHITSKGCK